MEFLKFDINAMTAPKSKEDYSVLLDEALLLIDEIQGGLLSMGADMARRQSQPAQA